MSMVPVILGTVLLVITGQLLLKSGMTVANVRAGERRDFGRLARAAFNWRVVAGFAVYGVSALAWIVVLSRAELTFAFPFLGLGYTGVVLGAVLLLGERPGRMQWAGIAIVVAGVTLVAMSG